MKKNHCQNQLFLTGEGGGKINFLPPSKALEKKKIEEQDQENIYYCCFVLAFYYFFFLNYIGRKSRSGNMRKEIIFSQLAL